MIEVIDDSDDDDKVLLVVIRCMIDKKRKDIRHSKIYNKYVYILLYNCCEEVTCVDRCSGTNEDAPAKAMKPSIYDD